MPEPFNRLDYLMHYVYWQIEGWVDSHNDGYLRASTVDMNAWDMLLGSAKHALRSYHDCKDNTDRLAWVAWAMHTDHQSGCIFLDYVDDGFTYLELGKLSPSTFLHKAMEDGLESIYPWEELEAFVTSPYDKENDAVIKNANKTLLEHIFQEDMFHDADLDVRNQ